VQQQPYCSLLERRCPVLLQMNAHLTRDAKQAAVSGLQWKPMLMGQRFNIADGGVSLSRCGLCRDEE